MERSSPEDDADLGLRHVPRRVRADRNRLVRADGAATLRVLEEELGPIGVVDEGVDIAAGLLDPCVAAALVGHTRAPHLRWVDGPDERRGRLERECSLVGDEGSFAVDRLGAEPAIVEREDGVAQSSRGVPIANPAHQ